MIDTIAKTDNVSVNRNRNPINTRVGTRNLLVVKFFIALAGKLGGEIAGNK